MKKLFFVALLPIMTQAANYSACKITVNSSQVIRLSDEARKTEVSIVPSIGNLAYEMKVGGKNLLWTAFDDLTELQSKPQLCGIPFLAPWANRLEEDSYYVNGKRYLLNAALGNIRRDPNQRPIHGLLAFSSAWEVVSLKADNRSAEATSRLEFWRYPDLMAQFPFAHNIQMTYRLEEGILEVETLLENLSRDPMPVAVGFHPYFRVHDSSRDDWKVYIAAQDQLLLSPQLLPSGEKAPLAGPNPVPLRSKSLDNAFVSLIRDASGKAHFRLEGRRQRVTVSFGQKFTVAVIWGPPGRDFVCIEPMAAVTNAFNLAHQGKYSELQSVPPGKTWRESFWVQPSGF
jgi:aldose 1-epimerase